jgi:hypothetical protein
MRQFIRCKFHESDTRTYTYHNDGEPVAVGDMVKVPDNRSDGWKRVKVVEVDAQEPTGFATKGILGKVEDDAAAA